ncbi:MAG: FecR domain-containing protein, partial [Gemmatimonadetes bacterium]|nr:FecR domain-containing protein [Gemmatimonadota bacterium]
MEGSASPAELEALRHWRAEAPDNEQVYQELARLWEVIPRAPRSLGAVGPPPEAEEVIRRAGIRMLPFGAGGARVARVRWATVGGVAAAMLVVGFAAAHVFVGSEPAATFGADEFVTGPSGVSTVTLRDGSVVRLGPRSQLRLTGPGIEREVTLEGHAFFAVAHAPDRPFTIVTSAGRVTALGTRFDLQAGGNDLSLVLLEGKVRLSTPGREVSLGPG